MTQTDGPSTDGRERGFTLVELLVAVLLLGVVFSVIGVAVSIVHRTFLRADDEATGLADVKVAAERLGRDLRNARGIAVGATESELQVWIDANSNYRQDAGETVVWNLVPAGGGHYDVQRTVNGTSIVQARTVVSSLAFTYLDADGGTVAVPVTDPDVAGTITSVQTQMQYDSNIGQASGTRDLVIHERLRNVE